MKVQMCFENKTVGGGGVCRANGSAPSNNTNENSNEEILGGGDSDGNRKARKVPKCKGVRRIKRKSRNHLRTTRQHNGLDQETREVRGEMIKEYLCKLQEIVPFSRKDKRLSKLEVITNAIDYIRELRETLGMPPCISSFDFSHDDSYSGENFTFPQLPSLSSPSSDGLSLPSSSSSSTPFYSLIPEGNCNQHNSIGSDTGTTLTDTCSLQGTSLENHPKSVEEFNSIPSQESWGDLRQTTLWTISVPSNNRDNDSNNASLISSTAALVSSSCDKVPT